MLENGNECKNPRISLVAATFEKANTFVFAAPIIRDREVGGSNPLAPTSYRPSIHLISRSFRRVANLWTQTRLLGGRFLITIVKWYSILP